MDLSSSKKRKSESDLGRPPIRKNPTIGGVFRLFPEEFENNSLNVEKRTPNVNSLLKTASGLLQKKNTKLQNPSGQLPYGQRPAGQVTSGQFASGKIKTASGLLQENTSDLKNSSGQTAKGQLISKGLLEVFISTKNQQDFLRTSALASKKRSNQKK